MPGVKYNGRALKLAGKARKSCCCGSDACCPNEFISRYEREGVSPTTPAELGTVIRAEIIAATNGCADVGDFIFLYEDSPIIWCNRPDEPLDKIGFLCLGCQPNSADPNGSNFSATVAGCPSGGTNNNNIARSYQCNPFEVVIDYTIGESDLVCFGCPMTGGTYTLRFTLERIYGDPP